MTTESTMDTLACNRISHLSGFCEWNQNGIFVQMDFITVENFAEMIFILW